MHRNAVCYKVQPRCARSGLSAALPITLPHSLPDVLPCYQRTFNRRPCEHSLRIFRAVNFCPQSPLSPPFTASFFTLFLFASLLLTSSACCTSQNTVFLTLRISSAVQLLYLIRTSQLQTVHCAVAIQYVRWPWPVTLLMNKK